MVLEKLKIKNLDNNTKFDVLFNPTEYTIEDSSTWQDFKKPGNNPELQYLGGARKKLSMELFCDTYEQQTDVRLETGKIARLLVPTTNQGNHGKRPPKVQLSWGRADPDSYFGIFPLVWVLEKLTQNFTLFMDDGTPVRAKLTVAFKEFVIPGDEIKRKSKRQSYPMQTYTVKSGETLSGIAASLWKDPSKWRIIAKHEGNQIVNPRMIEPGQTLIIPAIK